MPPTSPTLWSRTKRLTRIDFRPARPLPTTSQVALAGVVSVVASVLACVVLSTLGKAVLTLPAYFNKFTLPGYALLTIIGVVGATAGWAILVRISFDPRWVIIRASVLVTVVLLVPDVMILPHNPTGAVILLMVEHLVIAVITTYALLAMAPAGARPVELPSAQPVAPREPAVR